MNNKSKEYGPIWQLEQNIKHYHELAIAHGRSSIEYQAKAEDARAMKKKYEEALDVLKESGRLL